jgi:mono/diheme cytochrome c family protein
MSAPNLHGLVAYYADVDSLLGAVRRVREAGYKRFDAHSPFPVHGIDPVMGIRPTILPWLVLGAGLTGCAGALLMQWWTNGRDYAFLISGKPLFGLPAAIPVTFEVIILMSAFMTFFGMLALNKLPLFSNPLLRTKGFGRVTADRFAISIEAADACFEADATRELLQSTSAIGIEVCESDESPAAVPRVIKQLTMVGATVALIPPALIAMERYGTSTTPRIHIIPDMDFQSKAKTQSASLIFEDGRAMRAPVEGTLAYGEWIEDEYRATGKVAGQLGTGFPYDIDRQVMERGRQRYDIFCGVCHGADGLGRGPIAVRAEQLEESAWVPPTNLHDERLQTLPEGELFDVITNGVRTMPAYAAQMSVDDRWAVIAYLRALQRSRNATVDDLPADQQRKFK